MALKGRDICTRRGVMTETIEKTEEMTLGSIARSIYEH